MKYSSGNHNWACNANAVLPAVKNTRVEQRFAAHHTGLRSGHKTFFAQIDQRSKQLARFSPAEYSSGQHVYPDLVRNLPIRRIAFDDPAEKQQHDALVALADEMLQLQKDYAEAEREKQDQRHALKRRMDEVDAAIDKRVYNLYGLTEDEIKTIEAADK
jgi:hypothetical protein